jgi:hypothetical protein
VNADSSSFGDGAIVVVKDSQGPQTWEGSLKFSEFAAVDRRVLNWKAIFNAARTGDRKGIYASEQISSNVSRLVWRTVMRNQISKWIIKRRARLNSP